MLVAIKIWKNAGKTRKKGKEDKWKDLSVTPGYVFKRLLIYKVRGEAVSEIIGFAASLK